MPAETPLGIPYPLPDDAVVDYPALGQDLAETVDRVVGISDLLYTYDPVTYYVNAAAGYASRIVSLITIPVTGIYLLLFNARFWWSNTAGFNAGWARNGVLQMGRGVSNREDGWMLMQNSYLNAGDVIGGYYADSSTINAGDWGSTVYYPSAAAIFCRQLVALGELADEWADALAIPDPPPPPEGAPPDYVGPPPGPFTPYYVDEVLGDAAGAGE